MFLGNFDLELAQKHYFQHKVHCRDINRMLLYYYSTFYRTSFATVMEIEAPMHVRYHFLHVTRLKVKVTVFNRVQIKPTTPTIQLIKVNFGYYYPFLHPVTFDLDTYEFTNALCITSCMWPRLKVKVTVFSRVQIKIKLAKTPKIQLIKVNFG